MKSCNICLSVPGLSHSAWCLSDWSMLSHVVRFPFLWLNNILKFLYHIVFITSSAEGQVGCFCIWLSWINVAVNMRVQISIQDIDFTSFDYIPRSRIARSYGSFIFHFEETSILTSLISIPTSRTPGFPFLYIVVNSHPDRCDVLSHCHLDLHFPGD